MYAHCVQAIGEQKTHHVNKAGFEDRESNLLKPLVREDGCACHCSGHGCVYYACVYSYCNMCMHMGEYSGGWAYRLKMTGAH